MGELYGPPEGHPAPEVAGRTDRPASRHPRCASPLTSAVGVPPHGTLTGKGSEQSTRGRTGLSRACGTEADVSMAFKDVATGNRPEQVPLVETDAPRVGRVPSRLGSELTEGVYFARSSDRKLQRAVEMGL